MDRPPVLIAAFLTVLFCLSGSLTGWTDELEGMASLYEIATSPEESLEKDGAVLRSARVNLFPQLFALYQHSETAMLVFPTFSGDIQGEVTWRRMSGPDSFSFVGALSGGSSGYFVLTVHKGVACVSICDEEQGWFRIDLAPDGYVMQEVDLDILSGFEQGEHLRAVQPSGKSLNKTIPPATETDPALIDILVVYTPRVLTQAGSVAAIEARVASSVDVANAAYANSNIYLSLAVAHVAEVNYEETYNTALDLARLTYQNDGYLDEVHDLRDQYDADMVVFAPGGNDGMGWILDSLEGNIDERAFCITTYSLLGGSILAHELGHNMGCDHDEQNITAEGWRLFNYSRAWRFIAPENEAQYRTVMSYSPGIRILHFSNPDILYKGAPTGVPVGDPDEANNVQTINISAPYIAQNRPIIGGNEGEGEPEGEGEVTVYEEYYCQILWNTYSNSLLRALLPAFASDLFDLLHPDIADLNGGADPDELIFYGNGMLDCAYELGVISKIMETPTLDLSGTGGVTHQIVSQALAHNMAQLRDDVGDYYADLVEAIAPGLLDLLVTYVTVGDEGSLSFVLGLWEVINESVYIGSLDLGLYILLPEYLSADGDADGDGATNREEYDAYEAYGSDIYVSFALNPAVFPYEAGEIVHIYGRGRVEVGESTKMMVFLADILGQATIEWYKDGEAIIGASGVRYDIPDVTLDDAGDYHVIALTEEKAQYESPLFTLVVLEEGSLPLSGLLTLIVFTLVLSLGGLRRMYFGTLTKK